MGFTFKNIDSGYIKLRQEPIGDIQPKYWYMDKSTRKQCLVKRQTNRKVTGQLPKSKMFNHFGEYFGYLLGQKAGVDVCPVELVTVHDTKNKYAKTKLLYTACASYNVKSPEEEIYPGDFIVSKFRMHNPEEVDRILGEKIFDGSNLKKGNILTNSYEDNLEVILASIAWETMQYEKSFGIRTDEEIKEDIANNLRKVFEMLVYDCLFGNSDRHSANWAMAYNSNTGRVTMYPNYDNEAVLGLRKTEYEIKQAIQSDEAMNDFSENELYSRMGIAPIHSGVTYKNMLEYIVKKYPAFAIPSINKITSAVSVEDIEELYDYAKGITKRSQDADELTEEDELPEEFKIFGVRLYSERRDYALMLVREFQKQQKRKETERTLEVVS